MLSLGQDVAILIAALAAALLFMVLLNRLWPIERRRINNDLIGWQLSMVGTTYAVILGFMLYTVWTTYGEAQLNSDLEANCLRNVYHLAKASPNRSELSSGRLSRDYANAVLGHDWPEMARGEIPEGSHAIESGDVNHTVEQVKVNSPHPASTSTTPHRNGQSQRAPPYAHPAGRLQTARHLLGCPHRRRSRDHRLGSHLRRSANLLHTFQVMSLTLLLTLVLLAISDVNLPFQGWVHIDNYAFVRALQFMTD